MSNKIKNKSDQVFDKIIQMILNQELQPGDRLPVEDSLAEQFGVSRITIREAFKMLSLMGIVEIKQKDGTFVCKASPDSYMKPLLPMLVLDEHQLDQLYDARLYIEVGIAALATRNRTEEDIAALWALQRSMEQNAKLATAEEHRFYAQADREFHSRIATASQNIYLLKTHNTLMEIFSTCMLRTSSVVQGRKASIEEHPLIIRAIEEQDEKQAAHFMGRHISNAYQFYLDSLSNS